MIDLKRVNFLFNLDIISQILLFLLISDLLFFLSAYQSYVNFSVVPDTYLDALDFVCTETRVSRYLKKSILNVSFFR